MMHSHQITMVSLEDLVPANHIYRKFSDLWTFTEVERRLRKVEKDNNYKGYGVLRLFKCLLLQFMEDLSNRELERYLQENTTGKWFCGFGLTEPTPDYTGFTRIRKRIGPEKLAELFGVVAQFL